MGTWWRGTKGESWDNCNSIINKIDLKKVSWISMAKQDYLVDLEFLFCLYVGDEH